MLKKILLFSFLFNLFFTGTGLAQNEKDEEFLIIENKLGNCIDNAQNNAETAQCVYTAMDEYDKLLNKYYRLLMGLLSEEGKTALRNAQRKWLEMRNLEFNFVDQLYHGEIGGTMYIPIANDVKKRFVKQRVAGLKDYYQTLEGEGGF